MIRVATKNDSRHNNNRVATISLSDGQQDDVPKVPETSRTTKQPSKSLPLSREWAKVAAPATAGSNNNNRDTHNNNGRRRRRRLLSNCGGQLSALTRQPHGQSGAQKKEIQSGSRSRKMRRRRSGSAERGWCPGHGIAAVGECLTLNSAQVACVPFLVFSLSSLAVLFSCSIFCAFPLCDASLGRAKLCSISAIVWSDVLALRQRWRRTKQRWDGGGRRSNEAGSDDGQPEKPPIASAVVSCFMRLARHPLSPASFFPSNTPPTRTSTFYHHPSLCHPVRLCAGICHAKRKCCRCLMSSVDFFLPLQV